MCDVSVCFFSFPFFSAIDVECETFYGINSVGSIHCCHDRDDFDSIIIE